LVIVVDILGEQELISTIKHKNISLLFMVIVVLAVYFCKVTKNLRNSKKITWKTKQFHFLTSLKTLSLEIKQIILFYSLAYSRFFRIFAA